MDISYSDVEGGEIFLNAQENIVFNTSGGIIDVNPQFCEPNNNQFNLQEDSPCQTASDSNSIIGAYDVPCQALEIDNNIVDDYSLLQNYPNPFNPITRISYILDVEGDYSITIFDLQGKLVKNLISNYGEEGSYSVIWNGTSNDDQKVASGVYICRLEKINGTINHKMLMLK